MTTFVLLIVIAGLCLAVAMKAQTIRELRQRLWEKQQEPSEQKTTEIDHPTSETLRQARREADAKRVVEDRKKLW